MGAAQGESREEERQPVSSLAVKRRLGVWRTHPDVLEEPRAHDVGGVFGKDAAFVLGGVVVVIEEVQVLVELQLELNTNPRSQLMAVSSDMLQFSVEPQTSQLGQLCDLGNHKALQLSL